MTQTQTAQASQDAKSEPSRRRLRALGRKKRSQKLKADKVFAQGYFEAKSKRSNDKKAAYRKRRSKK